MALVTGGMAFHHVKEWNPEDTVTFGFNNKQFNCLAKEFNEGFLRDVLKQCGILESDILYTMGGINTLKKPEMFWAYEGFVKNPKGTEKNMVIMADGRAITDNVVEGGISITNHTIRAKELGLVGVGLAANYTFNSFMLRCWPTPFIPEIAISRGTKDGVLADFRNIPNSEKYVIEFKKLNWQIIWWQNAAGERKGLSRPKTGWVL